ncbi:unnamed protein product, partial [Lymnaea stagnalis]
GHYGVIDPHFFLYPDIRLGDEEENAKENDVFCGGAKEEQGSNVDISTRSSEDEFRKGQDQLTSLADASADESDYIASYHQANLLISRGFSAKERRPKRNRDGGRVKPVEKNTQLFPKAFAMDTVSMLRGTSETKRVERCPNCNEVLTRAHPRLVAVKKE